MSTIMEEMQSNEAVRKSLVFEDMVGYILKRFRPDDRYEAAEFERYLHSLIRQVFIDAQAPLLKTLTEIAARMPLLPPVVRTEI